jgi:hypothetical protein
MICELPVHKLESHFEGNTTTALLRDGVGSINLCGQAKFHSSSGGGNLDFAFFPRRHLFWPRGRSYIGIVCSRKVSEKISIYARRVDHPRARGGGLRIAM